MKNLKITITGEPNTGKSRFAYYLQKLLEKDGFNVELDEDPDYPTVEIYKRVMFYRIDEVIKGIKENTTFKIEQKQINKDVK